MVLKKIKKNVGAREIQHVCEKRKRTEILAREYTSPKREREVK
jgi:hypothetical protein